MLTGCTPPLLTTQREAANVVDSERRDVVAALVDSVSQLLRGNDDDLLIGLIRPERVSGIEKAEAAGREVAQLDQLTGSRIARVREDLVVGEIVRLCVQDVECQRGQDTLLERIEVILECRDSGLIQRDGLYRPSATRSRRRMRRRDRCSTKCENAARIQFLAGICKSDSAACYECSAT